MYWIRKSFSLNAVMSLLTLLMVSCGGGSSSSNNNTTTQTLSGTAAAGAPIVGIVNVKGANGKTASSTIDANGHFSLDVTALTANYILYAEGSVNGKTIRIYSAAVAPGTINITPITNLIVANAIGAVPDASLVQNWNGSQVSASSLTSATTTVQTAIEPLLQAANATSIDPLTGSFNANGTGLDEAMDFLNVSYVGSTATITNLATGSTCTNDVTTGSSTALPSADSIATQTVMTDLDGIKAFWKKFETLWATAVPSQAAINSQLAPYITLDFLNDGADKTQIVSGLASDSADMIGLKFNTVIKEIMDVSSTSYIRGYWVYVNDSDGWTSVHAMVYDGTNWLWYGDRRWLNTDLQPFALMTISATGGTSFLSGFNFWLDDDLNYAYDRGVRSAIVTGPGLPASGVKMELVFPETTFKVYQPLAPSVGSHYYIDDSVIATIPDNSEYTVRFYTKDAASATLSDTPIHMFTDVFAKPPFKASSLSVANFPTITSPTTHNLSIVHIPGTLNVSWTSPANEWVNWVWLGWSDGSSSWQGVGNNPGSRSTSTTLDMTSFVATVPTSAGIWMEAYDNYMRMFAINWQLN